ncbi:hypothetical protein LX32DRAFT_281394 [Colletotrichum zoysiae]|uniref:Uncharacterized protein n=1 Tax=Colletotrichum zoysiae TaxID=1216348 RepID=A0AAD9LWL9_9PEZI|nr:hypothetical protein LX32DRAFT_281394 [Colletotrichum zoysiae]
MTTWGGRVALGAGLALRSTVYAHTPKRQNSILPGENIVSPFCPYSRSRRRLPQKAETAIGHGRRPPATLTSTLAKGHYDGTAEMSMVTGQAKKGAAVLSSLSVPNPSFLR